jgi:hypothetical protein
MTILCDRVTLFSYDIFIIPVSHVLSFPSIERVSVKCVRHNDKMTLQIDLIAEFVWELVSHLLSHHYL